MCFATDKKLYASCQIFPDSNTILLYTRLSVCVSFLALSFPSPFNYYSRIATQVSSYSAYADHIWGLPNECGGGLITVGIKRLTKWRALVQTRVGSSVHCKELLNTSLNAAFRISGKTRTTPVWRPHQSVRPPCFLSLSLCYIVLMAK